MSVIEQRISGMREGVTIALDSIRANKVRAGLTILGIAVGVFVVVVISAAIHGINESVAKDFESTGPTTFFVSRFPITFEACDGTDDTCKWFRNPSLTLADVAAIDALPSVRTPGGRLDTQRPAGYKDRRLPSARVSGLTGNWQQVDGAGDIFPGRNFTAAEATAGERVVVINDEMADQLFGESDPLDKQVTLGDVPFRVIGVYHKKASFLAGGNNARAIVPIEAAYKHVKASLTDIGIAVIPLSTVSRDAAIDDVIALMRARHGLRPATDNNFAIITQDQLFDVYNKIFGTFFLVMVVLSAVGLIVGGVGVIAIMMISVTERTREIGVRKALGATRGTILFQFLVEAVTLTGIGAIIGLVLGALVALLIKHATPVAASVPPLAVVAALVSSCITGVLFGVFPAAKAARLDPVAALRYEWAARQVAAAGLTLSRPVSVGPVSPPTRPDCMPFHEAIRLALQQIRVQKLKSFFTLLGVMIGVMFLIAVVSIVTGMSKYVEEDFAGRILGANTFTVRRFPWFGNNTTEEEWREWQRRPRVYHRDVALVRNSLPEGTHYAVESQETLWATSLYSRPRQIEAHAVEGDYFTIKKYDLSSGRTFSQQEADLGAAVIVVGDEVAKFFFAGLNPIGRELRIGGMPYTVIGVIEHQGSLFGQSLDKTAFAPFMSPLHRLTNPRGDIDGLLVQAPNDLMMRDAMETVREVLRGSRKLRPAQPDNFVMETSESALQSFRQIENVMTIAGTALPAIGLVVGGMVIMNIMLVAVAERTREIGIRKALGARRKDILRQFLVEAATLSTLGAILGILLGILGAKVISWNTPLPAAVAPWSLVMATMLGTVVGIASGVWPARKAAGMDPIEALRQE